MSYRNRLRTHAANECSPVCELSARQIGDVFSSQPDGITDCYGCGVVAPARHACATQLRIAGEAVFWQLACASNMNLAGAAGSANIGIGCTWEVARPG